MPARVWVVAIALLAACASSAPQPTPATPRQACAISCPFGFQSHPQHTCRSSSRFMRTVLVKGRYTARGADGEKLVDVYVTDQGDIPTEDVILGADCDSYIRTQCLSKIDNPCAAHPGEPDPLHPFGAHR